MKITCDVIKDLAELYVGNALSEDSKNIVEAHIIDCPRCKEYIEMSRKAFEEPPLVDVAKIAEEKAELKSLKDKILGQQQASRPRNRRGCRQRTPPEGQPDRYRHRVR